MAQIAEFNPPDAANDKSDTDYHGRNLSSQRSVDRRSKLDTFCDILEAIGSGEKPTRIMYKANLSWRSLRSNLQGLLVLGMISRTRSRDKHVEYLVTNKGFRALSNYHGLKEAFSQEI